MLQSLISVIPGPPLKQEGVGDARACCLFVYLWNKKYAEKEYKSRVQWNDHDFGSYPDVGVTEAAFDRGIGDNETFSRGIEEAAGELCDKWNENLCQILVDDWKEIREGARLSADTPPFELDY